MLKKQLMLWAALLLLVTACRMKEADRVSAMAGLASPVLLDQAPARVLLPDFFLAPDRVDSIRSAHPALTVSAVEEGHISLTWTPELPPVTYLECFLGDDRLAIPVIRADRQKVSFRLEDKGYRTVQVKGQMNNWNPLESDCRLVNGTWACDFAIFPGTYQYLFVVDGQELADPANPNQVGNGTGGMNSLLEVPKPPAEVLPYLATARFTDRTVTVTADNTDAILVWWQNQVIPVQQEAGSASWAIPAEATRMKRSHFRVWGYNAQGLANDLLIPLEYGRVVTDPTQLDRKDKEAQIMYFALVDRFNDGNPANDQPLDDPRVHPSANFQGGDLTGIRQKIEDGYFDALHVNALWLSPITRNPDSAFQEYPAPHRWYSGYHGYWPVRSGMIDPRFGSDQSMRALVKKAHEEDINVLLDYVCNHVHQDHPMLKDHPEWATSVDLPDGRKNIRLWDEHRLTTWFDEFLPSLDLANPAVAELQADSALFWIREYDLDGFRHDASKHIPLSFWRLLTRKIKDEWVPEKGYMPYQIGETYGSRELIRSYIGSGLLDAQFDFNLHYDARDVLSRDEGSMVNLAKSLQSSLDFFGYHSTMGNISGNHDNARFTSLASGDLRFDEDHREAAFSRKVEVTDPIGYSRMQLLMAFNMAIPGVPVIYYGDEIGMAGAGDPDSRRMMRFDDLQEGERVTLETTKALSALRRDRMSLLYGDTKVLAASEGSLALLRKYFSEVTLVVFNKDRAPAQITVALPEELASLEWEVRFAEAEPVVEDGVLRLKLPGNSFVFLLAGQPASR